MNSVITLVSDYGPGSPYTAAMLGSAISLMPETRVVEVSHHIPVFDLTQAAFILRTVYQQFPKGSIHLICLDTSIALHKQFLFMEVDGHYFLGADNGVFSLLFDEKPNNIYKILLSPNAITDLFPEKNIFLPFVSKFLQQGNLNGLAEPTAIMNEKQGIQAVFEEHLIKASILYIDGYQNAITNISKELFERVRANRKFKLYYWGKHSIDKVSEHFHQGGPGEDVLLFNENNFLMIAMYRGRAAQLLGLKPGSKFVVEFEDAETN